MTTLRLLLVAALLALPLWVAQTSPAHACVCAPIEPGASYEDFLADRAAQADLIVVGEIGEMLVLPPESITHLALRDGTTPVEIKFLVSDYVKGSSPNPALIYNPAYSVTQEGGRITSVSGTDCDISPHLGDQYVMFLSKVDFLRYLTPVCSGTQSFALTIPHGKTKEEYATQIRSAIKHGPGLPYTGSGPLRHSTPNVWLIAASALAGIGLAANAAFALRRRD